MPKVLLSLSAIVTIIGSTIYIVSILKGRSKPHRITRFVLFFVLGLNFISAVAAHGNTGAKLYAGILAIYGAVFFFLSLKRGMGGSTFFDWTCLTIAAAGIVGWQVTGNAVLGVWLAAAADFVAYLPAIAKTWRHPHTESPWLYIDSMLGAFLSLVAYKISAVSIFQITVLVSGVMMIVAIYHKGLPQKTQ
jgi:hypothetical protein